MNNKSIVAAILFVVVCALAMGSETAGHRKVDVLYVYDGDSIKVNIHGWPEIVGKNIMVRLKGVDTPEIRGAKCEQEKHLAKQAKAATQEFVSSGGVTIVNIKRGKYFRLIADVYVGDESLANNLISQGLAREYNGGKRRGRCSDVL